MADRFQPALASRRSSILRWANQTARGTRVTSCRLLALAGVLLSGAAAVPPTALAIDLSKIETIVVIYAENRSFDHLYGLFPGANGIANATSEQKTQVDHDGSPLPYLPPVYTDGMIDTRFPLRMPNGPFRIDQPPINGRLDQ